LVECLRDPNACQRSSFCVSRDIWEEVSDGISRIFHSVTLEEMVNRKKKKEGSDSRMYQI
jgi:DNA-binding IscR family transcriptional regulator